MLKVVDCMLCVFYRIKKKKRLQTRKKGLVCIYDFRAAEVGQFEAMTRYRVWLEMWVARVERRRRLLCMRLRD